MKFKDLMHRGEKHVEPVEGATGPTTSLGSLREAMDRLFEDFVHGELPWASNERSPAAVFPSIDVTESADAVEVSAELPGLDESDVEVTLGGGNDVLVLTGQKTVESEREEQEVHHVERCYGSFRRSIALPCTVDPAGVEASFKKGVLKVRLPKSQAESPSTRRIPVSAG